MNQEDEEEMAQVFGSAGKSAFSMGDTRYQDLLSRIALPMLSLLLLIPLGYYLLTRGHFFWGIGVALFYVVSIKSLEQAGLKLKKRISHADTGAKAEQAVAEALQELPDDYYVFHDLEFPGFNIDHVVLGPNGIFLVETKSQNGNITQEHDVLLRNGRKFFKDFLKQCWSQAYSLRDHLNAERLRGLSIKPILCFSRGFVEIRGPVRGVAVLNVGYLRPYILSQRGSFPAQARDQIIPLLAAAVSYQAAQPSPIDQQSQTSGIVCPKCFHERTKNDDLLVSAGECPKCGVIYAHVQTNSPHDSTSAQAAAPKGLTTTLQALLSGQDSQHKQSPTQKIQWTALTLKLAACALAALLLIGAYKTMQATVTSIFSPPQTQTKQRPIQAVAFPLTHAVSSDNSAQAITFVFEEDRGQNVILLFFDNKAKTLALRACVRANEKLTTTLPRVDLGYVIVTGQAWQGYEDLFGPASEAKKALITLSSITKAGNVAPIRATSSMFAQKGAQSPLPETKAWIQSAFKNSGGFMKM
ncbi:MAG: NERD domain-containing protein [Desulfomicrobium sp.]|uniref:nuclease-related domain-containing protein n=1 Tax=Pseudodesulfovibrio sp. TaxID=2035812 RepID=UPI001ECCBB70|nr:nuclease-related domain-containing protein [Pseudodesulfovibrio sp.]MBV1713471.1 NERD domain-containing protein [Desulfomicrobium sp.]MBV1772463.1 NERD domain-containing protein [Pseudodesulfovibrio sp.]